MPARLRSHSTVSWVLSSTVIAGMPMEASHPSESPVTSYASKDFSGLYPEAPAYAFIISSVAGRIPSLHSDAYTALACECQNINASGLFSATKFRKAFASGSEKAAVPALTVLLLHVASGFHLQSKLRLRSTPFAFMRPDSNIDWSVDTSAISKRPTLPVTLKTPSGLREGITVTVRLLGITSGLLSR